MHTSFNPVSTPDWVNYVTTVQNEAAEYLGEAHKADAGRLAEARRSGVISERFLFPSIHIDNSDRRWFSMDRTVVQAPAAEKPKNEKEKAEERANQAKWIGSLLAIGGAFLAGVTWNAYHRQIQIRKATLEKSTNITSLLHTPHALKSNLHLLVNHKKAIDDLNASKATSYLIATTVGFIGAATLAAGGFAAAPWVITAGQVTLIAAAVLAAINLGLHWNDKEKISEHYKAILGNGRNQNGLAGALLEDLRRMNANMQLPQYSPPLNMVHDPIYPSFAYNPERTAPPAYTPLDPSAPDASLPPYAPQ